MGNTTITINKEAVSTRAEYADMVNYWTLNGDSYDGIGGFLDGSHLIQFARESNEGYERRQKRCYYANLSRSFADTLTGHLFKQPIKRSVQNTILADFLDATNKIGNKTMDELIKEAYTQAFVYGYCGVVIDKPSTTFNSLREELDDGKPYAFVISAMDIVDWQFDEFDQLKWIKIRELYMDNADDFLGIQETKLRFRVWTRTSWYLIDSSNAILETGDHNLGIVPVVWLRNQRSLTVPDTGITEFTAMVQINHSIFNHLSELDSILANKTFPILTMPVLSIPEREAAATETSSEKDYITLGDDMILTYDPDSKNKPEFISPSMESVESYLKVLEMQVNQMRELAKQSYTSGANSSGIAREIEFEKTNQSIKDKADKLQDAEEAILRIVAKWMNIEDPEIDIEYPRDFNLRDLMREIDQIANSLMLNISDRFNKELKKKASRTLLPTIDTDVQKDIDEEIDEGIAPIETLPLNDTDLDEELNELDEVSMPKKGD